MDRPRGRAIHVALATLLALAGVTLAVLSGVSANYQVSSLAMSGTFFALADSGNTIYAASDNGGSVILEKSTDRGAIWTANPVPYSAVAGGAPWDHAAVAADGNRLVLTASHADSAPVYPYPAAPPFGGGCGANSTLLVASSPDGGLTWTTSPRLVLNLTITSLQTTVEGNTAAVAWVGPSGPCGSGVGRAGATTSADGGRTWSANEAITPTNGSIVVGPGVEMAPEQEGILIAIAETAPLGVGGEMANQIGLWLAPLGSTSGFVPSAQFPAPSSWTLQGQPNTPAYLLTPTYLIPLTTPQNGAGYTAIPFNELQADGPSLGALPRVVSLVPDGTTSVEIAATTADNLGVDCWTVDIARITVVQTCHVRLGSFLVPSNQVLPIVALLDGGGWWVAIGASGSGCGGVNGAGGAPVAPGPYCGGGGGGPYPAGNGTGYAPPSAGAAVGTSVCVVGCSAEAGLAAYSYDPETTANHAALDAIALAMATVGLIWLAVASRAGRRAASAQDTAPEGPETTSEENLAGSGPTPEIRRLYVRGLVVWVLAWTPVAVLALLGGSGLSATVLPTAIVLGGAFGGVAVAAFHGRVRVLLQRRHGFTIEQLLTYSMAPPTARTPSVVRWTSYAAYASWAVGAGLLALVGIGLAGGFAVVRGPAISGGATTEGPAIGLWVSAVLLLFVLLRSVYHAGLALAASRTTSGGVSARHLVPTDLRAFAGAVLLPWNPLVGLILGWALQSILPFSPYLPSVLFLPVTLLGAALLAGCFGRTVWSAPVTWIGPAEFADARTT